MPAFNAAGIPAALRPLPLWCVSNAQKKPIGLSGNQTGWQQPENQGDFKACLRYIETRPSENLLPRFNPQHGGSFFIIDVDGCRDPGTGRIDPAAQELIDKFHTYTEVSRSGTGLHILAGGALLHKLRLRRVRKSVRLMA